jgi:hypothetical protein
MSRRLANRQVLTRDLAQRRRVRKDGQVEERVVGWHEWEVKAGRIPRAAINTAASPPLALVAKLVVDDR